MDPLIPVGKWIQSEDIAETILFLASEQAERLWSQVAVRKTISAGDWHTVGLKKDGAVVAVGENEVGECDVSDWKDIKTN